MANTSKYVYSILIEKWLIKSPCDPTKDKVEYEFLENMLLLDVIGDQLHCFTRDAY